MFCRSGSHQMMVLLIQSLLFFKEQGLTQAAIEEWLKQNFLDKIVTRWLAVNGKKSRFTLHNLGKIHFENHLWDGFSIQ